MKQERMYVRAEMDITRFTEEMCTVTASGVCNDIDRANDQRCISQMQCAIDLANGQNMSLEEFADWTGDNIDQLNDKCL